MKPKAKKIILVVSLSVIIVVSGLAITGLVLNKLKGNNGDGDETFDPGNRYESTLMDYMGVVYNDRNDIYTFTGGYSETVACPWGAIHPGIDYALLNDSDVIAAVPGQVVDIMVQDYGESEENRFMIHVVIRFNVSLTVDYAFEPWTNISANKDHQLDLLDVEEGQWVQKGDKIATFLKAGISAHIHFMVHENNIVKCPHYYLGTADYVEIMEMIDTFQTGWELCYH